MTKPKLIISGSAALQNELLALTNELNNSYEIIDLPKIIPQKNFNELYKKIHKDYLTNITKTDFFLLFNANKNGIEGYIGAESYAELCFAVAQNLIYKKDIQIYIYKMPSSKVQCYNEIVLWLNLGWIKIWNK